MEKASSFSQKDLEGLLQRVQKENPGLYASIAAFLAGCQLMLDDVKDFAKFDTPDHPSPFHHWLWGALLMLAGTGGMGFAFMDIISKLPPPPKMPPMGLLEQGVSAEEVTKRQ